MSTSIRLTALMGVRHAQDQDERKGRGRQVGLSPQHGLAAPFDATQAG